MTKWLFKIWDTNEYVIVKADTLREAKEFMYDRVGVTWTYIDYIDRIYNADNE